MIDQLSSIIISSLSGGGFTAIIAAIMYHKQNKRLKETEAQLAETNVAKAKTDSKADEFHLYKEMLDHANERYLNLQKQSAEREDYLKGECEKKDARYDALWQEHNEQTRVVRSLNEQVQIEKDLNTEYERVISEQAEENTYLSMWVCHKPDCQNGIPPRERLRGQTFDIKHIVRTHQRVKLLENKHQNKN